MSRDEGFAIADFSTSHHDDPKVKAMWRALQDPVAMNAALVLYDAVILSSWREGKRVTSADACPMWVLDAAAATSHLQAAGLLDSGAKIPAKTFRSWFGAAKKRRDVSREDWRRRKAEWRARTKVPGESNRGPTGLQQESRTPFLPSVPTESKNGRDREGRARRGLTRVGDVLAGERDPSVQAGLALLVAERTV